MEISKLEKYNIGKALELVWKVFEEFEAPEYSKEGVMEFRDFISYESIIKEIDKGNMNFWGCFYNEKLVGVIATRSVNHISLLFVRKEYHRQGIASSLFKVVEGVCRRKTNINNITVNSSPYGKDFYHSVGFVDMDKEKIVNGIRFIPMTFNLG